MKVTRKMQFKTNDFCVGDQITVRLRGFGKFSATAQKVIDEGVLFLFDEVIGCPPMNEKNTNVGGFDESDMSKWLRGTVLSAFPKKMIARITDITIPTYGEILGHDDFYENFEPDNDEQFKLMKQRRNRVCDFQDDSCWWWLRNATKKALSSADFACVGSFGNANYVYASSSFGVRPEFLLVR